MRRLSQTSNNPQGNSRSPATSDTNEEDSEAKAGLIGASGAKPKIKTIGEDAVYDASLAVQGRPLVKGHTDMHMRQSFYGVAPEHPPKVGGVQKRPNPLQAIKNDIESYLAKMKEERFPPVLEPNGYFIRIWNPFVFSLTIFAVLALPIDVAFTWVKFPTIYKVVGKLVDVIFIADVVLHFNTGVLHGDHVCYERKEIAIHYLKTWFLFDLASNTPFDWFAGLSGKYRKVVKFLKFPKVFRFIRMLRLIRKQVHYVGIGVSLWFIGLLAHYGSCIWILALLENGCVDDGSNCPDSAGTYAEGVAISMSALSGSDSWTRFVYSPSSSRIGRFRTTGAELRGWEEAWNVLLTVMGYILLACLFGTIYAAIEHMNARGRRRYNMLMARKTDMSNANIPWELQQRVEATYEHAWLFGDWHDGFLTDTMLSLDLRRNLAYHVYGHALLGVPMFSDLGFQDLKCLSQKIKTIFFAPGDLIIQAGERAAEMYLVFMGVAQPLDMHGNVLRQVLLQKGDFFGELSFLFPGRRRTASVVAIEFCRLMVLTLDVFSELGLEHLLEKIRETCAGKLDCYVFSHTECVLPADFGVDDGRLGRKGARISTLSRAQEPLLNKKASPPRDGVAETVSAGQLVPDVNIQGASKNINRASASPTPVAIGNTVSPRDSTLGPVAQSSSMALDTSEESSTAAPSSPAAAKKWGGKKKEKPRADNRLDSGQSGESTPKNKATDVNANQLAKLMVDLREASDRNTAEILNRLEQVERNQGLLADSISALSSNPARLASSPISEPSGFLSGLKGKIKSPTQLPKE